MNMYMSMLNFYMLWQLEIYITFIVSNRFQQRKRNHYVNYGHGIDECARICIMSNFIVMAIKKYVAIYIGSKALQNLQIYLNLWPCNISKYHIIAMYQKLQYCICHQVVVWSSTSGTCWTNIFHKLVCISTRFLYLFLNDNNVRWD